MKRFSLVICICLVLSSLCFCLGSCNANPNDTGGNSPITGDTEPGDVEKYIITFRQSGEEDVVMSVEHGATLANIPQPIQRPGYTVTWEEKDLTNITQFLIVNAIESANSYTVTYNLGVNSYATLDEYTVQVTYNEEFTLKTPQYSGSAPFLGWYLADENGKATGEQVSDGKYLYAQDVTVIAKWREWSPIVS